MFGLKTAFSLSTFSLQPFYLQPSAYPPSAYLPYPDGRRDKSKTFAKSPEFSFAFL
jgi:hypothetical protein